MAASLPASVRSSVWGSASQKPRTAAATCSWRGAVRCESRANQFRLATSSDGGICRGRYRRIASLSVVSAEGAGSTVSKASVGELRNTRSRNWSPSAGVAPSCDNSRTGKLVPSTLSIHWPEGSRVTAASRIAPTRHCVSCCDIAPARPDEVYVTDSIRMAGPVANRELHHPDIGTASGFLEGNAQAGAGGKATGRWQERRPAEKRFSLPLSGQPPVASRRLCAAIRCVN